MEGNLRACFSFARLNLNENQLTVKSVTVKLSEGYSEPVTFECIRCSTNWATVVVVLLSTLSGISVHVNLAVFVRATLIYDGKHDTLFLACWRHIACHVARELHIEAFSVPQ